MSENKTPSREMMGMAGAAMLERKRRAGAGNSGQTAKRGNSMRTIFGIFPLLAIPVIIYNLMAFVFAGGASDTIAMEQATGFLLGADALGNEGTIAVSGMLASLRDPLMSLPMIGDAKWAITAGDALLLLSIALLFIEILKATSTGTATIFNHAVSMLIFIVCLVEFLLFPEFATSVFFIITMMALLDVLAGVMVTIVSARRDFAVGEGFGG